MGTHDLAAALGQQHGPLDRLDDRLPGKDITLIAEFIDANELGLAWRLGVLSSEVTLSGSSGCSSSRYGSVHVWAMASSARSDVPLPRRAVTEHGRLAIGAPRQIRTSLVLLAAENASGVSQ